MMEIGYNGSGLITIKGDPVGVSLGMYGCAEHECGIKHIKEAFGVRKEKINALKSGLMTKLPE